MIKIKNFSWLVLGTMAVGSILPIDTAYAADQTQSPTSSSIMPESVPMLQSQQNADNIQIVVTQNNDLLDLQSAAVPTAEPVTFSPFSTWYRDNLATKLPTHTVTLTATQDIDFPYQITIQKSSAAGGEAENIVVKIASNNALSVGSVTFKGIDPLKVDSSDMSLGLTKLNSLLQSAGGSSVDIVVLMATIKVTEVDSDSRVFFDYQNKKYVSYKKNLGLSNNVVGINTVSMEGLSKITVTVFDSGLNRNVERTAWAHVPAGYSSANPMPVILNFHGLYGDGLSHMETSGMNAAADAMGFIVVYPEGIDHAWSMVGTAGANDVSYVSALLDNLQSKYPAMDANSIYVTGISNGGQIALRVADELGSRIKAVAIVASGLASTSSYTPAAGKPVMIIHGSADPRIPYDGGAGTGIQLDFLSVDQLTQYMVGVNGAVGTNTYTPYAGYSNPSDITITSYGSGSSQVVQVRVDGGGHTWPGGQVDPFTASLVGATSASIDASKAIANFFLGNKSLGDVPADIQGTRTWLTQQLGSNYNILMYKDAGGKNIVEVAAKDPSKVSDGQLVSFTIDAKDANNSTLKSVEFKNRPAVGLDTMQQAIAKLGGTNALTTVASVTLQSVAADGTILLGHSGQTWAVFNSAGSFRMTNLTAVQASLPSTYSVTAYMTTEPTVLVTPPSPIAKGALASGVFFIDPSGKLVAKTLLIQGLGSIKDPAGFFNSLVQLPSVTNPMTALSKIKVTRFGFNSSVSFSYEGKNWKYQKTSTGGTIKAA